MANYYPATPYPMPFFDPNTGELLSGGSLEAYRAASVTPVDMYSDKDGTSAGSTITLNAGGYPQVSGTVITIHLRAAVDYKFILKDSSGNQIWSTDNISNLFKQVSFEHVFDDITALKADPDLAIGDDTRTKEHTSGYGAEGGANYTVVAGGTGTADDRTYLALDNGLQAKAVFSGVPNAAQYGADTSGTVASSTAIQALMDDGQTKIPAGTFLLDASLTYQKDRTFSGEGYSFQGSYLKPTGDFPALKPDSTLSIDYGKNIFRDFAIDGTNVTTQYALVIDDCYTTHYENLWIRNTTNGVSITTSDAISFTDVRIMEDSDGDAVFIGDNARAIRFFGCNFEKNPGNTDPGGTVRIDGNGGSTISNADFYGCQIERGRLIVNSGAARWFGGKTTDAAIQFLTKSQNCVLDHVDTYGTTTIRDFGYNNSARDVACANMMTHLHQWPALIESTAGAFTFGSPGDERVFLVTAASTSNAAVTSGVIEIKDGSTALATSPTFSLPATGNTYGMSRRQVYSYLAVVKNTNVSGPVLTNCKLLAARGGANVIPNGTFSGGASTSWSFNDASNSASGDDLLVTPTNTTWGIYQNISSLFKKCQRYIVVAKYTGTASLCLGSAWDGAAGSRVLVDDGQDDLYGDGDRVAMLSFEYTGQSSFISLGSLSSSSAVTIKWIAAIPCD